jgi:[ribosomal protein S5]-alanine N-acetyltransferase
MKHPITQPRLETERLFLRAFNSNDAPAVQQLAGRREIADTTISIPHPYSEAQAREWIMGAAKARADGRGAVFALELKSDRTLIGAVGLRDMSPEHLHAELGFWIGINWWGHGYATEATRRVLAYGFEELKLNRIYAFHMTRNPASGRVMQKIGMKQEGLLRQAVRKWGLYEDVALCAIIWEDWKPQTHS